MGVGAGYIKRIQLKVRRVTYFHQLNVSSRKSMMGRLLYWRRIERVNMVAIMVLDDI